MAILRETTLMKTWSLFLTSCGLTLLLSLSLGIARAAETSRITPVVPYGYGANIHETQFPPAEVKLYQAAGFGLVRMDFYWQNIESKPGIYDFSAYDAQLAQLRGMGVRPVWILDYTNTNYDNNQPPQTSAGLQAFAHFAHAAAAHFKNQGVIWEIWNEPNTKGFWSTGPNADQYATLVKAAPAIRSADPKATILAGAISTINLAYITQFLKDDPLKDVTALSVHPYRQTMPETVIPEYAALHALLAENTPAGQKPIPIACSEWGYTTANGSVTDAQQARYASRMYLVNLLSGVDLTIDYDWKDDGPDPANSEHRFGIVRQDLTPKPAYTAVSALLNTLRGYRFQRGIAADGDTNFKLLFVGPKGVALVTWSSDPAASEQAQTPSIELVDKGSYGYAALLRQSRAK